MSVGDALYSVPHELIDERVWVRADGEELIVVHVDARPGAARGRPPPADHAGPAEHQDEHYPPRPAGALERRPRARSSEEREFLAIGDGAERWLKRAAAEGAQRMRRKMAEAVDLAKLHGTEQVNEALERCASSAGSPTVTSPHPRPPAAATVIALPRAPEERSLQRSTRSWEGFGR